MTERGRKEILAAINVTERGIIVIKGTKGVRSCLTSFDVSHSLTRYYKGLLRVSFKGRRW